MPLFVHGHHVAGHWLPRNDEKLRKWCGRKLERAQRHRSDGYKHPVIQEFRDLIESDPTIYMGFTQMFAASTVPNPIDDYKKMLSIFDLIIGEAPEFQESTVVAIPITAILLGPMNTQAGFAMFSNPRVNHVVKKMLDVWHKFLVSKDSAYVLSTEDNGWFGPAAKEAIPNFAETFKCDPGAPHFGFDSWDHFFIREFCDGVREVELPTENRIINSVCESTVFRIQHNASERDQFWIKGHPYSLTHMLNNDELSSQFIGGTVYQAFLSALSYHHFHSPVDGVITKVVLVPGTYYLQAIDALETNQTHVPTSGDAPGPAPDLLDKSQDFITQVAARGLVFIEADNPKIGLMCFIAVGMVEVSTVDFRVQPGQRVKKGDHLGMFHFGGSTHCLVFKKDAQMVFDETKYPIGTKVPVKAAFGYTNA
ncbi:phosphatidylserine decarboxylase-like protein [Dendrothele bispora CBS 962.96]|uniref:Phosphatidylserine decarboxylase-like protein n=1 Tax=Dendrothele bispora (strain CBS 962.96) TaxID=1314807 RepID=A0A4S8LQ09_DENBC|nr:phosphatidylserine decarboxylase-like protein [Dendrothele bispora CBS 962.96]THU95580.1 phosphatidylserine decarboxylase-like protein [Dendrothele bispora CBS 962.96]